MSAKRKDKAGLIRYEEASPPVENLRAMIAACASGSNLSTSMRAGIIKALKSLEARHLNDELRRPGMPVALNTFRAALLANELIKTYRVKPEYCATSAAAETMRVVFGASGVTGGAVGRALRKLKRTPDYSMTTLSGEKYQLALITDGVVDHALARLPAPAKGMRTNRAAAPPFLIVVIRLTKPEKSGNK